MSWLRLEITSQSQYSSFTKAMLFIHPIKKRCIPTVVLLFNASALNPTQVSTGYIMLPIRIPMPHFLMSTNTKE